MIQRFEPGLILEDLNTHPFSIHEIILNLVSVQEFQQVIEPVSLPIHVQSTSFIFPHQITSSAA